jgi:hypothetical protein
MKYIFKQVDNISGHNAETTIEFSADTLSTILEHFEMFIRGCGFHPSGTLDFIPDEEYYGDGHEGMGSTLDYYPEFKEEHEWTQTLRNDSEWPFPLQKESESTVMDWTAAQLIRPPKMEDVCPVCKIDMQTMLNHECWDNNCPKGKDAN